MPRTVDHEERRATIVRGLVSVAAREGLHAATMRSVAAEAGVSLRLVQYYFGTKAGLLAGALERLERESRARWSARLADDDATPRATVEALLEEGLPTDGASRAFHRVWTAFAVLAATDPELAAVPFVEGPRRLEAELAALLRRAGEGGALAADADPDADAAALLALHHGLGTGVLVGQRSADEARAVLRRAIGRVFATP